jgi:SAM-dependent methyltransferase
MDRLTRSTSERFGYLWTGAAAPVTEPIDYHLEKMRQTLGAPPLTGRVLDAGCGEGLDLASLSLDPNVRAVGLELSTGGSRTSRIRAPRACVIQGDLRHMPFADASFDAIYSYGVIHHTTSPARVIAELARTLRPGGVLLVYLYEDFEERALAWRVGLRVGTWVRRITTRLRPQTLMTFCRMAAPLVYATCSWPSQHFRWAARLPYHHCATSGAIVPDLYDRLAAPIEYRYSRSSAIDLVSTANLTIRAVAQNRGWMLWAEKGA